MPFLNMPVFLPHVWHITIKINAYTTDSGNSNMPLPSLLRKKKNILVSLKSKKMRSPIFYSESPKSCLNIKCSNYKTLYEFSLNKILPIEAPLHYQVCDQLLETGWKHVLCTKFSSLRRNERTLETV